MEGAQIGPYRILGDLGSGGMGKVYLAEVAGKVPGFDDGCRVALKVIHPHLLETPGFFHRFLREAEIGKSVEQDNVVRCFDCDSLVVEGTRHDYLVMEYVEGQTLRDLLNELERVPEELCRHIGREIAKGLVAIHDAGVIHRDLKPENVLITEEHVVKVMDLGVAWIQDEAIRLSQTGGFVGSLEYAAPERLRIGVGRVDERSDLYALGLLLYELSTGLHPNKHEDMAVVLRRVLDETPRRAGEVNPQLSPFFEEIVHTLLAKDPGQRFPRAAALLEVLEDGEKSKWWWERAKALRIQTKSPLRRIRIPRETALYGRDDDLAKLRALYEGAKAGEGQVLLIEGEAGIGKTRLVDEFMGRLRHEGEDLNFLFGSYPPGGAATAAGAFSTAYREQFGVESLADTLKEYLTVTPVLIPAFAALLRGETTPTGAEPLTKASLQTVFTHATRELAAQRTTVVLIDDLHFAPEDGRALFSSLAMAVPGHRILLLGTMRPGVPEGWTANVTRLDHAEQRSLSRLGPKDLFSLLKDSFRSDRLAEELGFQISVKCDGNPFFAFEIIRGLREGQLIAQHSDGTWVTTRTIRNIQVPSSVLDLVNARVADLSDEERDLLDVAACCGFKFDPRVIADAMGEAELPTLKRLSLIERRHRLVRSSGRAFVFDHHQVQEALYEGLPGLLRERYHAAIAGTLEIRAGTAQKDSKDLDGTLCVDLCDHFFKGAQGGRALPYLHAALDHLEEAYQNDSAIAMSNRGLDVPGLLEGAARFKVLLRKNSRLELLGKRGAQEAVLAEARTLAEESGDKALLSDVEGATARLLSAVGRYEDAREHLRRHLVIAREIADRQGEYAATGNLGNVLSRLARYEEAREHYERALAIAREIGDRRGEGTAAGNVGGVFWALGRHEEARAQIERQLVIAREAGDRQGETNATLRLGNVLGSLGCHEEAREHYQRAIRLAREIGDRRIEVVATDGLGNVFQSLGRLEDAWKQHERALVGCREIGSREGEAFALVNLGPMWLALGEAGRARQALEASLAICRQTGARYPEGYALLGLSAVAQQEEDGPGALDLASEALALRREIGHGDGVADSLHLLGELRWRAGDGSGAEEALLEAADLLRKSQRAGALAHTLALLACLPAGGVEEAQEALKRAGESGNTPVARFLLWKSAKDPAHVVEAKRLLDHMVEHAPAEYRESMLKNVRLYREIMEAWEEHGGEAQ